MRLLATTLLLLHPGLRAVAAVCTSEGVTAEVTVVTADEPSGAAPETPQLSAAYPNPFRTQTTLALTVPTAQRVTVELFDTLGQTVATLFDGAGAANEPHMVALQASTLPSGLYVVRVSGEGFSLTRRVTLLR